jgi:hypothetical protein
LPLWLLLRVARPFTAVQFLGAAHSAVEERRLAQRLDGMDRRSADVQAAALAAQAKRDAVATAEERVAQIRAAEAALAAAGEDKARLAAVRAARVEAEDFALEQVAHKKAAFLEATLREQAVLELRDSLNVYGADVRHANEEQSRTARGAIPRPVAKEATLTRRMHRLPEDHPLAATLSMRATQSALARAGAIAASLGSSGWPRE